MEELISLSLLLLPFLAVLIFHAYQNRQYRRTSYYQITRNPYSFVKHDKGKFGEYATYKNLRSFENTGGKFLFNVYIPKENNETTEIDVILVCSKGVVVLESKNYSGWIFGNEAHRNWTQTLPYGWRGDCHKERFYNPILQNATHIKYLKRLIGENIPIWSVIVFSDECTLKSVTVNSHNISVVNRRNVLFAVNQICEQTPDDILTQIEIYNIYTSLYPYTQVDLEAKERHQRNLLINMP